MYGFVRISGLNPAHSGGVEIVFLTEAMSVVIISPRRLAASLERHSRSYWA
jgi:hypothetical protein